MQNTTKLTFSWRRAEMQEQSAPVKSVHCSKGHNNYDPGIMMTSETNAVYVSARLNEDTCSKSQFVRAVPNKQVAVGMGGWGGRNQVCVSQDLQGM